MCTFYGATITGRLRIGAPRSAIIRASSLPILIMSAATPVPVEIKLHSRSRVMEIAFDDGAAFQLPFEFLRVYSPSAEVRGHGPGQEVLQVGKKDVDIVGIEPVGSYAIQPRFSDGHNTGIYSWDYLYEIGANKDAMWQQYLQRLAQAGANREADVAAEPQGGHGCGSGSCGCH